MMKIAVDSGDNPLAADSTVINEVFGEVAR
jgi:hypothetical protein